MVVDFSPPETLLAQLIELRKAMIRDATHSFAQWRPFIWRSSFRSAAWNLAYYLALQQRDAQKLERALMPWGLSSLDSGISSVLPHLDGTIASLGAVCRINPTLLPQHPSPRAFFRGERLLKRHTNELFGDRPCQPHDRHHWIVPCPSLPIDASFCQQLRQQQVAALRIDLRENPKQGAAAIAQFQANQEQTQGNGHHRCKLWLTLDEADLGDNRPDSQEQPSQRHGLTRKEILQTADLIEITNLGNPEALIALHHAIQEQTPSDRPYPGIIVSLHPEICLEQLPEIIVRGAGRYPFGIGIPPALIPEVQLSRTGQHYQAILDRCQAACVPVILMNQTEASPQESLNGGTSPLVAVLRSLP
ncbi:MAG: pyruvate kinase [Phormidium sp. OSCR]|nr:MAG: pyruvate kinase [Phormidium sp. OSCR]